MLKKILENMRIEPEILNGLTDQEKQTLFCIMREEQIKRWRDWDEMKTRGEQNNEETYTSVNLSSQALTRSKKLKKYSVEFLLGSDGEPWVWVMGEHENDKSIEEILSSEAQKKARELAEQETKELRKSVGAELTDILEYNNTNNANHNINNKSSHVTPIAEEKRAIKKMDDESHTPIIDDLEIYCTVDELRERMHHSNKLIGSPPKSPSIPPKISVLKEISYNRPQIAAKNTQKVAARVALWEQRLITERSAEIMRSIQKKQEEKAKEAEEAAKSCDHLWKEQERKAKEAELKIRDIARKAREEHRKSLNCDQLEVATTSASDIPPRRTAAVSFNKSPSPPLSPPSSLESSVPRPPNPDAVLRWYRDSEMSKGTGKECNATNASPAKWFHGLLGRTEAESMLASRVQGSFLVRLSEKIWGYAISYKDEDRCKHYLVDASSGHYQFLGTNQTAHRSLEDLLAVHASTPITTSGNELLKAAVPNYRSWEEILQK